jgi:hypothetical protein
LPMPLAAPVTMQTLSLSFMEVLSVWMGGGGSGFRHFRRGAV